MRRSDDRSARTTEIGWPWRGWWAALWVLSALVGIVIGLLGRMPMPVVHLEWVIPAENRSEYVPRAERRPNRELVLVYMGSSTCGPSNSHELRESILYAKREMAELAESQGIAFAAVGVAADLSAASGLAHLRTLGLWDEVVSGRSWRNAGTGRYVYRDMPGVAATPQVLVVMRSGEYGEWSTPGVQVVLRMVGVREISEWAGGDLSSALPKASKSIASPGLQPGWAQGIATFD